MLPRLAYSLAVRNLLCRRRAQSIHSGKQWSVQTKSSSVMGIVAGYHCLIHLLVLVALSTPLSPSLSTTKGPQPTSFHSQTNIIELPTVISSPEAAEIPQQTSTSNLVELPAITSNPQPTESPQPSSQTDIVELRTVPQATESPQPTSTSLQANTVELQLPTVTIRPQATESPQPTSVSNLVELPPITESPQPTSVSYLVELPTVTSSLLATESPQPSSQTNTVLLPTLTSSPQPTFISSQTHTVLLPTVTSSPQATFISSQTHTVLLPTVTSSPESPQLLDLTSSEAFKQTSDLLRTVQVIHSSTIESLLPSSFDTQLQTGVTQPPQLVTMETTIVPSTTLPLSPSASTILSSIMPTLLPYTVSIQAFSSPSLSPTPPPTIPTTSYGGDPLSVLPLGAVIAVAAVGAVLLLAVLVALLVCGWCCLRRRRRYEYSTGEYRVTVQTWNATNPIHYTVSKSGSFSSRMSSIRSSFGLKPKVLSNSYKEKQDHLYRNATTDIYSTPL